MRPLPRLSLKSTWDETSNKTLATNLFAQINPPKKRNLFLFYFLKKRKSRKKACGFSIWCGEATTTSPKIGGKHFSIFLPLSTDDDDDNNPIGVWLFTLISVADFFQLLLFHVFFSSLSLFIFLLRDSSYIFHKCLIIHKYFSHTLFLISRTLKAQGRRREQKGATANYICRTKNRTHSESGKFNYKIYKLRNTNW